MTAPDSSVLVAGADPGHPFFDLAEEALAGVLADGRLIAHTLAETYNVLTSAVYGRTPGAALAYLDQFLGREAAGIAPGRYPDALREIATAGITGPAIYDGLIALAARNESLTLLSLDLRARTVYDRCGADYELWNA